MTAAAESTTAQQGTRVDPSFEELAEAVDHALEAVSRLDEGSRKSANELKSAIEAFHRSALVEIVRALREDPRGKELLFELVDDPAVRAVFSLHEIIKADPMTRAKQALENVRPYLQSHGGDVELVRIDAGVAFVRLQGSCSGCSMSAVTLRDGVEEALVSSLPEIDRVEVLEDQPTASFIPISAIGNRSESSGWVKGPRASEVPDGAMLRFDIEAGGKPESFVVTHVGNRFAVFRNACVHQGMTLDGGRIESGQIICPWHGFTFDAVSGECISAPGAQLEQIPTRIDDGQVWVRADAE